MSFFSVLKVVSSSTSSDSLLDFLLSPLVWLAGFAFAFCFSFLFFSAVVPWDNSSCCVDAMRSCLELRKNRLWQLRVADEFQAKQLVSEPKLDRPVSNPWAVASVISYCSHALSGQSDLLRDQNIRSTSSIFKT